MARQDSWLAASREGVLEQGNIALNPFRPKRRQQTDKIFGNQ